MLELQFNENNELMGGKEVIEYSKIEILDTIREDYENLTNYWHHSDFKDSYIMNYIEDYSYSIYGGYHDYIILKDNYSNILNMLKDFKNNKNLDTYIDYEIRYRLLEDKTIKELYITLNKSESILGYLSPHDSFYCEEPVIDNWIDSRVYEVIEKGIKYLEDLILEVIRSTLEKEIEWGNEEDNLIEWYKENMQIV